LPPSARADGTSTSSAALNAIKSWLMLSASITCNTDAEQDDVRDARVRGKGPIRLLEGLFNG
jgi:hypothetical protein